MTKRTTHRTIEALRWLLGVVVLWASCPLLRAMIVTLQGAPDPGHLRTHAWFLLTLASVEIMAAIMFLAPVVNVAGSHLLLAVFALAMLFHLLQGQFDFGALLVYTMAVIVWLAHRRDAQAGLRDEL
jgi:hypothetical protein